MGINFGNLPLVGASVGSTPLKGIALGSTVLWSAFSRHLEQHFITAPYQPPQNSLTPLKTMYTPSDMIVDIDHSVSWRSSQANQEILIQVGSYWVASAISGSSQSLRRRLFVPSGYPIAFLVNNNTTTSLRWIDFAEMSINSVDTLLPDSGGALVQYNISANVWGRVMTWIAPEAMTVRAEIIGFVWGGGATSSANRQIRIRKNGEVVSLSADEGTSLSVNITVEKYDEIIFEAMSASGTASFRDVNGGSWAVVKQ